MLLPPASNSAGREDHPRRALDGAGQRAAGQNAAGPCAATRAADSAPPGVAARSQTVVIAANLKAGVGSHQARLKRLRQALRDAGYRVSLRPRMDDAARDARELLAEGALRAVLAAGGDGTLNWAANVMPPEAPLAPLPLGTENLLARAFDLRADAASVCRLLRIGTARALDAGSANGRLFLTMLGCGFDAEVVRRMAAARRGPVTRFSYAAPIWRAVWGYRFPELRVRLLDADGIPPTPLCAKWAFVFNLPAYAAGLRVAPGASPRDGALDWCAFRRGAVWHGLRYFAGVALGLHTGWSDFERGLARRLVVESDDEVPYQLDGEFGGFLPVETRVLPGRVSLLTWPTAEPMAAS